jgi:L-alanine-DL-glutamate epimerase-like enolase superfamily enzyme
MARSIPEYEMPMFDLPGRIKEPLRIVSIELLKHDKDFFVRTRSSSGVVGVAPTKQISNYVPIFSNLVARCFLGEDARDIERLVDKVYYANYKEVGIPFWCPVAYVEESILDMLGHAAGVPVGELLGGIVRHEVPVYLSGSKRDTTAEEEVAIYEKGIENTGSKTVKFKIGGRMSRNEDAYPGRTEKLIRLARERLGKNVTLYADANGSYDAANAVRVGRLLEEQKYAMFEEPCPWEEYTETQRVTRELDIPVACGEQDSSLWRFRWMMENHVMDVVQFDINYNGGLIRACRVAKMAEKFGMKVVPHNTQRGASSVNIVQFASRTKNLGPAMEHTWRQPQWPHDWYSPNFIVKEGRLRVPQGSGLGIEIDRDFLAKADVVAKVIE